MPDVVAPPAELALVAPTDPPPRDSLSALLPDLSLMSDGGPVGAEEGAAAAGPPLPRRSWSSNSIVPEKKAREEKAQMQRIPSRQS